MISSFSFIVLTCVLYFYKILWQISVINKCYRKLCKMLMNIIAT